MVWCVMVKGPCRGGRCDFWARVRLGKQTVDEIVDDILDIMAPHGNCSRLEIEKALDNYWHAIGIKEMDLLRQEEPDLYAKMKQVEARVFSLTSHRSS